MGIFIFSAIYVILIIAWLAAAAFVWYLTFEEFWVFLAAITLLYIAALLIVKKKKKLEEESRKKSLKTGFAVILLAALLAGTVHYYRQSTYIHIFRKASLNLRRNTRKLRIL